jgi:hypothetical protein
MILTVVALLAARALALSGVDHRALCTELAEKNQLRAGMSVEQCIRQLASAEAPKATQGEHTQQEPVTAASPSKAVRSQDGLGWAWLLTISLVIGYVLVGVMWVRAVRKVPAPILDNKLSVAQAWDLHIIAGPRIATADSWSVLDYFLQVALWPRLEYSSYRLQLAGLGVPRTILAATISVVLKRLTAETLCVAAVIALPMVWFRDDQVWLRHGTRLAAIVLWMPLTVLVGLIISPAFWVVHYGIELVLRLFPASSTRR